ncbi:MAG: GNAT family N-acetyltransferase [Fimbriimonadaceae bacterium]|nr:GNAT family N-acetyltransferase [Fimbriimonadaceae bacterium]
MGCRLVVADDSRAAEFWHVLSLVYSGRPASEEDRNRTLGSEGLESWSLISETDSGQAAAVCRALRFTVMRGGLDIPTGGIAAVGTDPAHRRTGAASELMTQGLRFMKDQGLQLASLYPYRDRFYRRFGYESCGWRWQLKAPVERAPFTRSDLPVRTVGADQLAEAAGVYEAFARRWSGNHLRSAWHWRRLQGDPRLLVFVGEPAEGYVLVENKGFWQGIKVHDMAWSTPAGRDGVWSVLQGLCSNQNEIEWNEPPSLPSFAGRWEAGIEAKMANALMCRALDVPGLLRSLPAPDGSGRFSLRVRDELLPENEGPWLVEWEGGRLEVRPADRAGLELDIRSFSTAYMGSPSLSDLRQEGRLSVQDEGSYRNALRLLGAIPVTCMDFF